MREFFKTMFGNPDRKDTKDLGEGVWRSDYWRFRRAVDRMHQVLEQAQADDAYHVILTYADEVGDHLERVREVSRRAQAAFPSSGDHVPAAAMDVHHALTKAATHAATLAQSAAMLGWATAEDASEVGQGGAPQEAKTVQDNKAAKDNLDRKSGAVDSYVEKAEAALQRALHR